MIQSIKAAKPDRRPEFESQAPCGRRREPTLSNYPLTSSTHVVYMTWGMLTHIISCIQKINYNVIIENKMEKRAHSHAVLSLEEDLFIFIIKGILFKHHKFLIL